MEQNHSDEQVRALPSQQHPRYVFEHQDWHQGEAIPKAGLVPAHSLGQHWVSSMTHLGPAIPSPTCCNSLLTHTPLPIFLLSPVALQHFAL